jgi:Calx-beta domain
VRCLAKSLRICTLASAALLALSLTFPGTPALAACHSFTVEVDPSTVTEDGDANITVRRDAAAAPSQIDVFTVDGTAVAGEDFRELNRTISFTSETEQTLRVRTFDDDVDEPRERFDVRLSNPEGCSPNPNFVLGPNVRVAIQDNDAAPAQSPTSEVDETSSPSPAPGATEKEPVAEETGGGLSWPVVGGVIVAVVVIGALIWGVVRRRGSIT